MKDFIYQAVVYANTDTFYRRILFFILIVAVLYSLYVLFSGFSYPVLDRYGFRQAQTAITADYFVRQGFQLAYHTPVLGPPWSIPFEFPFYQALVALVAQIVPLTLDQSGRLVSILFQYVSVFSVYLLLRRFGFSAAQSTIATILLLLSPFYLFWGRTFMIESTALALGLFSFLIYFHFMDRHAYHGVALAVVVAALSSLTKVTTFSVLAGFLVLVLIVQSYNAQTRRAGARYFIVSFIIMIIIPILIASSWNYYADFKKSLNPLADFIVSSRLAEWNFGTIDMRFSAQVWLRVLENISYIVGSATILFLGFLSGMTRRTLILALVSSGAFLSGPIVFANLYRVHEYYYYANGYFVLLVLASAMMALWDRGYRPIVLALLVAISLLFVSKHSIEYSRSISGSQQSSLLPVANAIRTLTESNDIILIYGLDWSSEVPYYAQRRAIMDRENRGLSDEEMLLSLSSVSDHVGAVIFCPHSQRAKDEIDQPFIQEHIDYFFLSKKPYRVGSCDIYTKKNSRTLFMENFLNNTKSLYPPKIQTVDNGLAIFSHMPSKTEVVLEPALVRKIGFGVLDSAWLGDNNFGGACFSLEGRDTSHVYFNKCIEPKTNLSDRGTQFVEVDRDSDEMLLFQIIPMQSSDWGWTYWTFTFENSKKAFD